MTDKSVPYHTFSLTNIEPGDIGSIQNSTNPYSWPEFCTQYKDTVSGQPSTIKKPNLLGLCAATFDNDHRSGTNFRQITILSLDFDEIPKEINFREVFSNSDYNYLLIESPSSSWSHRKYRVYVPFEQPITNGKAYSQNYLDSVAAIHPHLLKFVDRQCKDCARFMYIPNQSKLSTLTYETTKKCLSASFIETPILPDTTQTPPITPPISCTTDIRIGQIWALPTFDLTLNTAPPGVPKRPTSDSGHHLVTPEGIKDFNHPTAPNSYEFTTWRELHALFSAIHRGKLLPSSVHPYYLQKWHEAGDPILTEQQINPTKIKIVEDGTRGRYYAVLKGEANGLQPLDPVKNEFGVVLARIKNPGIPTLAEREDIEYFSSENNSWSKIPPDNIKSNIRAVCLTKKIILGWPEPGLYYSAQENKICEALHGTRTFAPIHHPIISTYLLSLPLDHEWLLDYLHYLPQVQEHALPWIHMFGPSQAGKTLFAQLCASLWTEPPVTGLFMSNFQSGMGTSPIILMDEEIPSSQNKAISVLNACKILVTAKDNEANKKFEVPLTVTGYHRLFSTENSDDPAALNIPDSLHLGALVRRCLVVGFGQEQKDWLNQQTAEEIGSWLKHKFGEHLAWLKQPETRRARDPQGLIAVQPYENQHLSETNPTGELPRGVMETVVAVLNSQDPEMGYFGENRDEYFLNLNSGAFQDKLIARKITLKSKSAKYLKSMIMRCVKGSKYERTMVGGDRQRVISLPFGALSDLAENLGLELKLTEKLKQEEKEKIKNK